MNYVTLLRREPRVLAYGALHYFFSAPGQTFFISLFVPYFLVAADVTRDTFNWLYLCATLGSALAIPWVGGWLDRLKIRYVSMGVGLGLLVAIVLGSMSGSWWHLVLVLFGLRLFGQGMMPLTGSTAIARYFTIARGKALSLINFGISLAEVFFPIVLVTLIGLVGWRWSLLSVSGLVMVAFFPLVFSLIPIYSAFQIPGEEKTAPGQKVVISLSRWEVLRQPRFYLFVLVYIFVPMFMTGIMLNQSQIGLLLEASEAQMALGITLFGLFRMVTNLIAGPLVDLFSAVRVFVFVMVPLLLGAVVFIVYPSISTTWVFFSMAGVSSSLGSLTNAAMWAEIYGTAHLGSIKSIVSTFMVFSTAVGPLLVGLSVADLGELQTLLLVAAGLMSTLIFLASRLAKPLR